MEPKHKYRSFNVEELVRIIEHCALDLMGDPIISDKKSDGTYMTLTEVSHHNSMVAMHNDGIRLLAQTLIDELDSDDNE